VDLKLDGLDAAAYGLLGVASDRRNDPLGFSENGVRGSARSRR
jgi:hypothetical protein